MDTRITQARKFLSTISMSSSCVFIEMPRLNDLLVTLERFGLKLSSVNWFRLGEKLKLQKGTLEDIKSCFIVLKTIMDIIREKVNETECIDCLRECLSLWLEAGSDTTFISLISTLVDMAEETSDDTSDVLSAIDAMIGYYVLKQCIDKCCTIPARWTSLSVSGHKNSGKKTLLNLLLNHQKKKPESITKEEAMQVSGLLVAREDLENNWDANSFSEVVLNSCHLPFSKYFFCSSPAHQPVPQHKLLHESICKALEEKLSSINASKDEYYLICHYIEECKRERSLLKEEFDGQPTYEVCTHKHKRKHNKHTHKEHKKWHKGNAAYHMIKNQELMLEKELVDLENELEENMFWRLCEVTSMLHSMSSQLSLKCKVLEYLDQLTKRHSALLPIFPSIQPTADMPLNHVDEISSPTSTMTLMTAGTIKEVMKFCPNDADSPCHLISVFNTGGCPAFYDIAPSLLHFTPVNIIVYNLEEGLDTIIADSQLTCQKVIESTVRSLNSLKPPANVKVSKQSNFAVIGTHYTNTPETKKEIDDKNYRIKSKLVDFGEYILRYGSSLIFPIDAKAADNEHTVKISKALTRKIAKCYIEDEIPIHWLLFKMELGRLQKDHLIVEKSDCLEIGRNLSMTAHEVEKVLILCHQLAIVLYFHKVLSHIVFLDPQYLLYKLSDLYDQCKTPGLLDAETLNDVFGSGMLKPTETLKLLEGLLLAVKIVPETASQREYFLPYTLRRVSDDELEEKKAKLPCEVDPLLLYWKMGQIPQGLFPALIVQLIRKHDFILDYTCLHRNIIILKQSSSNMKIALIDTFFWLEVYCLSCLNFCLEIKGLLFTEIEDIISSFNYKEHLSSPSLSFICHCKEPIHPCIINEDTEVTTCIFTGMSFLIKSQKQRPWIHCMGPNLPVMPRNYIKNIDVVPTILQEASFRARKWMKLGKELDLSKAALDSIKGDSISQCLEECLKLWMKEKHPTWKILIDALNKIGETTAADNISKQL